MTFFTVPINNTLPFQKFKITLSGVIFSLELRYNNRMDRWVMNINDPSNNQILQGLILLINRNLTKQYPTLQIPVGVFFATDDTNQGTEPTEFSFGVDHSLWYGDPTQ